MHNRQQKGKRNMSQNVLVVHGGGPTAVINASLYGVIEEAKRNPEVGKVYGAIGGTGAIFSETFIDLTSFNDEKLKLLLHTFLLEEKYAPLAQLVEQLTLNQWVHGSSP